MRFKSCLGLCGLASLLPTAAFAHPGSHVSYHALALIHHFFSQPDHLLFAISILLVLGIATRKLLHIVKVDTKFKR